MAVDANSDSVRRFIAVAVTLLGLAALWGMTGTRDAAGAAENVLGSAVTRGRVAQDWFRSS